jgi:hypothetical protein
MTDSETPLSPAEVLSVLERQADALERIATALESFSLGLGVNAQRQEPRAPGASR